MDSNVTYIGNIARCSISAVGMAANLLILFIIARYPAMRTVHNLYVANLAAADFCFCVFVIVEGAVSIRYRRLQAVLGNMVQEYCQRDESELANRTVTVTDFAPDILTPANCTEVPVDQEGLALFVAVKVEYDSAQLLSDRSCDVGRAVAVFLAAASIYHLIAIACERYQAITKPFNHRLKNTLNRAAKTCAKIWAGALLTAAFDTMMRNVISRDWTFSYKSLYECVYLKPDEADSGYPYQALNLINLIILYVIPACVMIPVYTMIFLTLRRQRRFAARRSTCRFAARRPASRHHAVPMLFAVTVFFLVCWLPFHVTAFTLVSYADGKQLVVVYVATALAVLNSVINPFLYAFLGINFRMHIRRLLCSTCCNQSNNAPSPRGSARTSDMPVFYSSNSGITNETVTT